MKSQDYDLQYWASSSHGSVVGPAGNQKRIIVDKVWYKSPFTMWRFYAYYGALNVIGNLSTYGQYSDDSTFEVVPTWQNKLQAMAYEDSIYTRVSHYSYEIIDNYLRLFPQPQSGGYPDRIWFRWYVELGALNEDTSRKEGLTGINNMLTRCHLIILLIPILIA